MMTSAITPPRAPASASKDWLPEPAEIILDGGTRVILAERPRSPIVEMRFVLDRGFAAEPGERSGLAGLAMAMFSEGALRVGGTRLDVLQEALGATFGGWVSADGACAKVSALAGNLPDVLALCARLLANSEFERDGFERVRANRLALIARERRNPVELALRILPAKLYGAGDPYARPFGGSGDEASVAALTAGHVRECYEANLKPGHVTLVVAGPLSTLEAKPLFENTLGRWSASAAAAPADVAYRRDDEPKVGSEAAASRGPAVTLVDRPDLEQAALVMGLPTVARDSVAAEALIVADAIVAGMFSSRLNLKLREERGWTYGVRSSLIDARLRGLWLISSFVRRDRAAAAMTAIGDAVNNIAAARPFSPSEVGRAVDFLVARMPAMCETCAQAADMLARNVICKLPLESNRELPARLRALTPRDVAEVCRRIRAAWAPYWMVVGDAAELVSPLRKAGFTEIDVLDSNSVP